MGTGYTLQCRKCGYEISADLGVGFLFPRVYQQAMKAARAGKLGKKIQQFLREYPDGALDVENVFLQCPECGRLEKGQDLSMYVRNPDVPRREKGIWSVAAPFADADYVSSMELKEEQTYTLYAPGHICEKCGKPMKSITDNELMRSRFDKEKETDRTEVSCPECGDLLWIAEIDMWD